MSSLRRANFESARSPGGSDGLPASGTYGFNKSCRTPLVSGFSGHGSMSCSQSKKNSEHQQSSCSSTYQIHGTMVSQVAHLPETVPAKGRCPQ